MSGVDESALQERLQSVRAQIEACCRRVGRDPSEVQLLAVSKGHPASLIRAAYELGQREFGENFAQELREKASALSDLRDLRWHFIGRFQSNKSNALIRTGAVIQTVFRASHLEALNKRHRRVPVRCMLQVRFDENADRSGAAEEELPGLLRAAQELPGVNVTGLMLVPPQESSDVATRAHFGRLRELASRLGLAELSMGMSGDYELAIEEGSTILRIGTAIFGPRDA